MAFEIRRRSWMALPAAMRQRMLVEGATGYLWALNHAHDPGRGDPRLIRLPWRTECGVTRVKLPEGPWVSWWSMEQPMPQFT